ncbi:NUDIX hydrolase [Streptomyces sp. NPDC052107]|uniref:NUDIX hydrolase n=1 Tax=Streptomyces sp. NPDC052107 TaxID=3155632 RepID=UPI003414CA0C
MEHNALPDSYKLGATCVAFNTSGQVLIARRQSPDRWELPGGLVDPGESLSDAAARETFEETTVRVNVCGLVGLYQHPSRRILAAVFIATAIEGAAPQPTQETREARWSYVPDALCILHPLYRPRLEDALAASNTVAMRVHEGSTMLSTLAVRSTRL